ncbi:MAG TPA: ACT domain-containing protein, partial [Blastocatellia bacterium]|nr:ACT domain-containing protein [Blastocatellia bacterium]
MPDAKLDIVLLEGLYAVCQLSLSASGGNAAALQTPSDGLFSITKTDEEISVVCAESAAPENAKCETGWRCFKVQGP